MKKGFVFSFILFALVLVLPCQTVSAQVNRGEMENLGPVDFINYEGPYSRIDTREEIRALGYGLGVQIRAGQTTAGPAARYFVIHSVSDPDGSKIDADIMGLGTGVGVDHIRNLRRIIQGYLEAAYDYTESDASLLAEYITIYNAVYRQNMDYFNSRYKNDVMSHITEDKAGLSTRYDEWPGRTLMLIPLGIGDLNAIDTTTLVDPRVTEQLREEPDQGLDTRRDMVDLLERQADQAGQQAAAQREANQQGQAAQDQAQQQLDQDRQQGTASEDELAARQQELDDNQAQLDRDRQQAEQTQQTADNLADAAQQERQNIASDQQAAINASAQNPAAQSAGLLGASILTTDTSLGRVVLLDSTTGRETRRSPLTTVNVRTLNNLNGRLIAIAGENRGDAAIRLVELDPNTLEMIKQGDDDMAPTSLLWVSGNNLYALNSVDGSLYIARYNMNFERQARSAITVHPQAAVIFIDGNNLATQRADGSAVLLNPNDLTER